MNPIRQYKGKPLTKPGKRSTPLYLMSPRQRKKAQKQERRMNKGVWMITDDPIIPSAAIIQ